MPRRIPRLRPAQDPPVQYVADAETPEHAAYIALMHPGVSHALADLLKQSR
ncbi:hypothetical protein [Streptomyces filamentosus]|uniref:hypothetical protein n=1 Tax=Streptomyces filamentosus TaxID=67294 RepID=UPI001478BDD9|nr:hypothetical protein [Streptomyces filamentosus]